MFQELVLANRSYRTFDPALPVSREQLLSFVNLARLSASSANRQPLKYAVISEPEQVAGLLALTKWAAALPQLSLPPEGKGPTGFVVICHDHAIVDNLTPYLKDVGIAAQTMLLAATEAGFGGCMIGNFAPAKVAEFLKLPDSISPQLVVAFGKPAEDVRLVDVPEDGSTAYYRDESGVHYVPKRTMEDVLLG